jgi:hypothetical protein
LLYIAGLESGNGLERSMMGKLRQVALLPRTFPMLTHKFGKIDGGRASHAASGAREARPQFVAMEHGFIAIHQGPFDHLPGGEVAHHPTDRATSGTYPAFHAVIDLFLSNYHSFSTRLGHCG